MRDATKLLRLESGIQYISVNVITGEIYINNRIRVDWDMMVN